MKTIRIDRKKWARGLNGNDPEFNYLWNNDTQKGCCLGHVIHQVTRCSWNSLNNIANPQDFFKKESLLTFSHLGDAHDNGLAMSAMGINDDSTINDSEREGRLQDLFIANCINLEFYN